MYTYQEKYGKADELSFLTLIDYRILIILAIIAFIWYLYNKYTQTSGFTEETIIQTHFNGLR